MVSAAIGILTDATRTPVFGVLLTMFGYSLGLAIHRAAGRHPLAHPALVAILAVSLTLEATGVPYDSYMAGGEMVGFLLGPAVVLLAVPLVRNLRALRDHAWTVAICIPIGAVCGAASTIAIAVGLGGAPKTVLSTAPKSVTTGIAIEISEAIGGITGLTAVLVIGTGAVGAMLGPTVARILKVRDERAIGLALGVAGHGMGTARALQISSRAGAFAALGMALNGIVSGVLLSLCLGLLRVD